MYIINCMFDCEMMEDRSLECLSCEETPGLRLTSITQGFNHARMHSSNVSAWQHASMYCDMLDSSNPGVLGVCSCGVYNNMRRYARCKT